MAYTNDTALLATVNDAIDAALTGRVAEYRIGGRDVRYIPLAELTQMRDELERRISRATGGGGIAHATFRRGL